MSSVKKALSWIIFVVVLVFVLVYLVWDLFILPTVLGKKEKDRISEVAKSVKKTKCRIDDYLNTHSRAERI